LTEIWKKWYRKPYPWATRGKIPPSYLVLHHTAGPALQPVEVIRQYHEGARGWPHIGYHFVVTPKAIYKTLPLTVYPICVRQYNPQSICVAITGDWSNGVPSEWATPEARKAMDELKTLVAQIRRTYPGIRLVRHMDLVATGCPGILTWDMVLNWGREVEDAKEG